MKNKFNELKTNIAFKEILSKEENYDILKPILENVLEEEIEEIESLSFEENSTSDDSSLLSPFNVIVTTPNKKYYLALVFNMNTKYRINNFIYLCDNYHNLVTNYIYDFKTKVVAAIVTFTYNLEYCDKAIDIYQVQTEDSVVKQDDFAVIEVNLDYLKKIKNSDNDYSKYKYLTMLTYNSNNLEEMAQDDEIIKKYKKEISKINENEELKKKISLEEKKWE